MCRTRFGIGRTRPEIRTPVHSCVKPETQAFEGGGEKKRRRSGPRAN